MSQLTPQKTKTCHQVKVLRFLLSSQLLNGIVCLTEDSQSWVCVRAGTGGAELPLDIFTIEGARHRYFEMFCAPLLLKVGNAGNHLVRATQRQAGCPEGPLKNYLISKNLGHLYVWMNIVISHILHCIFGLF